MSGDDTITKYDPAMDEDTARKYGRPPKYSEELLDQAYEYLTGGWQEVGQQTPSIVGLALYLGIVKSTVYKWAGEDDKEDFSDICEAVNNMQESCLINNGLIGVFSPPITKMMMTKHGYSDKVETVNTNTEKKIVYIDGDEKAEVDDHISSIVDD